MIAIGIDGAPEIGELEAEHHVGRADGRAALRGLIQRMTRWEIQPPALIDHGRLQRFRELDERRETSGRTRRAIRDDDRVLGGHEQARDLGDRGAVTLWRSRQCQLRHAQLEIGAQRTFLQLAVGDDQHRPHRRRHGQLVRAHRRFGEVLQRDRCVVPLRKVAHERRGILDAVRPLHPWPPLGGVERVADDDVHRHAIAIRVVDGHRGVLKTDGAVCHDADRPAVDFGKAVRHRDRRLFVAAGQQLRSGISAVVDERLVESAKAGSRVCTQVLETQAFDDVHHAVGAAAIGDQRFGRFARVGRRRRLGSDWAAERGAARDGAGGVLQKCSAVHPVTCG